MCNTYSQIFSSVYLGLGQPEQSILPKLELSNIVQRRTSFRLESVRQSEQGISIAKSSQFTLAADEDEKNLTTLESDFVIPMWIEQQVYTLSTEPVWRFVPTVNLAQLQQKREEGVPAVAFYGSNYTEVISKFSYFGQDVNSPFSTHQVWYIPTMTLPTSEDTPIELPDNLVNMIVYDTFVSAIPIMQVNMSKQLKDRPELEAQMTVLNGLYAHYKGEQAEFQIYFDKWRKESRGAHRPRRRGEVLKSLPTQYRTTWSS